MTTALSARQLVVFSLGEEEYALPITRVREIVRYATPRTVASDTAWMRGVISLRGAIVPVCDLAARLGSDHTGPAGKIVVVETLHGSVGVAVDDVREVRAVDGSQFETIPGTSDGLLEAIARIGDRLVVLLDADRILSDAEAVT